MTGRSAARADARASSSFGNRLASLPENVKLHVIGSFASGEANACGHTRALMTVTQKNLASSVRADTAVCPFSANDSAEFLSNKLLGARPTPDAQCCRPVLRCKRHSVIERWTTTADAIQPFSGFSKVPGELEKITVLELFTLRHPGRDFLHEGIVPREPFRGEEPHVAVVPRAGAGLDGAIGRGVLGSARQRLRRGQDNENGRKGRQPGHGFLLTRS